ncbi:hypothetical protein ACIBG0_41925 [Nocardia sp. NPDC050630]|uniref:hypothetical protein n=1 Tax=Nocardia sp. NPDC050630 TaxID=3364321 RepID=UPI0037B2D74B
MPVSGWRLCYFPGELLTPSTPPSFASLTADEWAGWLAAEPIPARTPFLLSPSFGYDVALNSFFTS